MSKKMDSFLNDLIFPVLFDASYTENKTKIFRGLVLNMLSRTLGMFEWKGLPKTLSSRSMEIEMQTRGFCCIAEVDNPAHGDAGLYCFRYAQPAGELNAERLPTRMVAVDPWLNFDKDMIIDDECLVIPNDALWLGLSDLFSLHAGQLADAQTTMRLQLYNARINKILTATDDKVVQEAKQILEDIKAGKWGVIGDEIELEGMMKALSAVDFTSPHSGTIKDTMEVLQYYLAQWFISVGLNDNFNMKREALNGTETESNANTLFALPLMMKEYRELGVEKLNQMYGKKYNFTASVEFKGVWKTAYKKYLLSLELQKKEAEEPAEDKPAQEDTPTEEPQEDKKDE